MHIKTITLEGFKSYRDRTVIGPFDRHFNAITGLNGSGKSNILDAICFVLGVNSLTTVRATCLADLIYKGCGINRASVSITFDNSDKTAGKCPPGYEDFPEIIVSRVVDQGLVCKYYLNSLNSTKNAVSDMFQHVGININHPNFIIMQGKITKVVNMKPMEVLQMIEETCGATAYQKKRDRIEKDIKERERKMEGMAQMIQEVILPALDQQTKAQTAVQEYHLIQRELNEKEKSLAIVSYLHYTKNLEKAKADLAKLLDNEDSEAKDIEDAKEEIERLKAKQEELTRKTQGDHTLERLTKEFDDLKKPHHHKEAQVNSAAVTKKEAEEKVKKATQDYEKEEKHSEKFRSKSKALIEEFESIQQEIKQAEENIAKAKDTEEKVRFGNLVTDSGDIVNVGEKVNQVLTELTESRTKKEYVKKEVTTLQGSVKAKEQQLQACPRDDETEQAFKAAETKVQQLEEQLRRNKIDPAELPNLENLLHSTKQACAQVENRSGQLKQRYPHLNFTYDKPTPNFDSRSVLGFVYEHFKVKDFETFGGAIEVAVGGRLGQMVVDTPETSKLLINKGNVLRRMTYLPLSQTQGYPAPKNLQANLDRAYGAGKAFVAVNLIEYEPKFEPIIQNVFGSLVITQDFNTAKKVAFEMRCKAVALSGDVADPGGIMQGGKRDNMGGLMRTCQDLRQGALELRALREKLSGLESQYEVCRKNQQLVAEHDRATRQLEQCTEMRALTTRATIVQELTELKAQLEEKAAELKTLETRIKELEKEEKDYQTQLKNEGSLREKNLKKVNDELKKAEAAHTAAKNKYQKKQQTFEEIEVELKSKADFLAGFKKDIDDAKAELQECEDELKKRQDAFAQIDQEFQNKREELLRARAANKELEAQCQSISKQIDELGNKIHELEIAKLKRETILKEHQQKVQSCAAHLERVLDENRGMEFNPGMDPGTTKPIEIIAADVKSLKKKHEDMRHRLDFEKAAQLPATKSKVVENQRLFKTTKLTRKQIEKTIDCLDNEKLKLVQQGYTQINQEFDTMMSILLPDSHAKLVPVNERNLMEGMNIHVCLGGVWKESLTELSGGQRSLVALSLVLSLCMYNPAPFYVLDEIDAALDLSHTQNIGYLLKHKFRTTQFVCVSLKDGMYSNANVLFQTQLLNGTSVVKRQAALAQSSNTRREQDRKKSLDPRRN